MNLALKSRLPVLLSAFVCPGAGQFLQKRWKSGTLFASGFLIGFIWLMVLAIGIIIDFYRMAFEFETYEPVIPNLFAFIAPIAISGLFFIGGLIDVVVAQQHIARSNRPRIEPIHSDTKESVENEK